MKYYIGTLEERNGEYEYTLHRLFATEDDPQKYLATLASKQYGDFIEPEDREKPEEDWSVDRKESDAGGWYFNCGEVHVRAGSYKEISESAYNELSFICY